MENEKWRMRGKTMVASQRDPMMALSFGTVRDVEVAVCVLVNPRIDVRSPGAVFPSPSELWTETIVLSITKVERFESPRRAAP